MEFVKRPSAKDTDEDLLNLQAEFAVSREKVPSTKIIRPKAKLSDEKQHVEKQENAEQAKKKPHTVITSPEDRIYGRFNIELDSDDGKIKNVLSTVEERYPGFFDFPEKCAPFIFEECNEFAKEDGFPEVLNLSDYYKVEKDKEKPKSLAVPGKSIFATEFLRRKGEIHAEQPSTSTMEIVEIEPASLAEENKLKLSHMSEEEIRKAQQEIFERFDVKTIEFLRNRAKLSGNPSGNVEKKESEFKKRRKAEKETAEKTTISTTENMSTEVELDMPSTSVLVEEVVKNLEVIDPEKVLEGEDIDPYTRLAMDPTQLDITNKCLRSIAPRQQQNLLKLFDNLKIQPTEAKDDQFLSTCRQHVDAIKMLYLEEFKVEENRSAIEFAEDVNPLSDGAWFLVPIRRVLDAVQMRKTGVTEDDIEIVRLSLMWAMLLMYERQTMFITLSQPNDVFIRVAEVFLIGPELLKDDIISQCLSRLINEYLLKKGRQHLLKFRANKPISGLDSFMQFYEDLIKHFEEFSYGDENFSLILLIGAYMNSYVDDSLLSIGTLWAPDRNVMRQMTISTEKAKDLLDYIKGWRNTYIDEVEEIFYERYSQVLAMYAAAIRDEKVTRSRNPAVFVIASTELGEFIKRHTIESSKHPQRSADLAIMVEMIRRTVDGKISL